MGDECLTYHEIGLSIEPTTVTNFYFDAQLSASSCDLKYILMYYKTATCKYILRENGVTDDILYIILDTKYTTNPEAMA